MWRRRPKRSGGLSKRCDRWAMKFCTAGRGASNRGRKRNTTPSRVRTGRKKNALLVHTAWENRNRGTGLYTRPARPGNPTFFTIGGSAVSHLLSGTTTSDDRLWRRRSIRRGIGQAERTLHYGIDIPVSTIRTITEKHGEAILVKQEQGSPLPKQAGVAVLITEMDGSMLPVVETAEVCETSMDRRKTRKLRDRKSTRLNSSHT